MMYHGHVVVETFDDMITNSTRHSQPTALLANQIYEFVGN